MFTQVRIKNFKSFAQKSVDLRPISIFIGPNSSGKSTVQQALLAMRQSVGLNKLNFVSESLDLGGRTDLTRTPEMPIDLGFTAERDLSLPAIYPGGDLTVEVDSNASSEPQRSDLRISSPIATFSVRYNEDLKMVIKRDPSPLAGLGWQFSIGAQHDLFQQVYFSGGSGRDYRRVEADFRQIVDAGRSSLQAIRHVPASRGFTTRSLSD